MVKEVPVMVNIFDAIQVDHHNMIKEPFSERRKTLKKIVKEVKEIKTPLVESPRTIAKRENKK